jgi:hypothetical protein
MSDSLERPDEGPLKEAAREAAARYAWEYFKYHAGQRQSVFRFYLTLVGVAVLAYAYSQRFAQSAADAAEEAAKLRPLIGVALVVTSFLFWRLDKRSRELIKNSETTLKVQESSLSGLLKDETIRLMHLGDLKCPIFPISEFETFRQIYSWIFFVVGILGAFLISDWFGSILLILFLVCYSWRTYCRFEATEIRIGSSVEYWAWLRGKDTDEMGHPHAPAGSGSSDQAG